MGALLTSALRPIKSFNIENRAQRIISKEKPTPAPTYPQNIEDLRRVLEAVPNIDDKLDKKDDALDERLKGVFVTSLGRPEDDITREKKSANKNRPLPLNRLSPPEYEYGFKEPDRIPYGKTTLRDAINFITAHQINPTEVTANKIALQYKLLEEDVESILKYFKTYEVYLPKTEKSEAIVAGPATMRRQLAGYKDQEDLQIESKEDNILNISKMKQNNT